MWLVQLAEHDVGRWHVPGRSVEVPAFSAIEAALRVVRWSHADAEVPPKEVMLIRASMVHANASRSKVKDECRYAGPV